jgi:type III pantothenate kinase
MKLLVIDAGNTRIKWGVSDNGGWIECAAIATTELHALAASMSKLDAVERVLGANVAGSEVAKALERIVSAAGKRLEWLVPSGERCGVRSSYARPEQLGPDRWAALIAARRRCAGSCVVVNAGTTMTVDALSGEGIFLGGCIVAGFDLMRAALARDTARLALQEGRFAYFPDNTGDAIASGAINALAGAVDRMCRHVSLTGEDDPVIVLSGGNADLLAPRLSDRVQVVDNLVLEGLVVIGTSGG